MEKRSPLAYLTLAARLLIGGLFVYACIHKIGDPVGFAVAIRNYTILPAAWSNIAAITLPWIELGAGLFLILGIQARPAALLTTSMLAVFLVALIYAYTIGLDIDCGCFSSAAESKGRVGLYHLVRDTALFLTSLFITLTDKEEFSILGFIPLGPVKPADT
ncbi:MAG: DoxX family membrane protein [Desulfomonile tiedjei]|nr:DoxX family membrane protein [Desulfomonile tiedjei]